MKKILFLLVGVVLTVSAQDTPQQMANLLRRSFTDQERLSVTQRMARNPSPEYAEVYEQTLRELVARRIETGSPRDRDVKLQLAILLVQQLGLLKAPSAETIFFQMSKEIRDAVLRGETFLSLGRIASPESVSYMNETLLQVCDSTRRSRDEEIVAYGLVVGLAESGKPESFPALFVASRSWFSGRSQVKSKAEEAWKKLGNSTELVTAFAVSGEALRYRLNAVRYLQENPGPADIMSDKAVEILNHGLNFQPVDFAETQLLQLFTREAAKLAIQFSQNNPRAVEPFSRMIEQNRDWAETVALIDATARGKTAEGITYLTGLLERFNQRQSAGGNNEAALRLISQLLASFNEIADPRTRAVLMEFVGLNYAPSYRQRAQAILDKLPGN